MTQRGLLVLHGNSFRVGDSCAVVLGHSGAGKSTLAAEMLRRGHEVLSDDVVPVTADGRAMPGMPRIKLWRDALDRLGMTSNGLDRVNPAHEKFHLPITSPTSASLPIRWIYSLDRREGPLTLTRIIGADAFSHLHAHAYRKEVLVGAFRQRHLLQSARLMSGARLVRVDRPPLEDTVAASADAILSDIASDLQGVDTHAGR